MKRRIEKEGERQTDRQTDIEKKNMIYRQFRMGNLNLP
jgi:hypothetical protein